MDISLQQVSYAYHSKAPMVLDVINAHLTPGIYLLLGENGAGKTTLLHIIAGLRFPVAGKCRIDGADTRLRLPSILSHVAYLGDNMEFPASTVNATVRCHAQFYPDFDPELLARLLANFGLTGDERLRDLSLGNRHKSQVAYMLSLRSDILLLDEPANGLDIESRAALQQMMAECITPEQTVIVSTHTFADLRNLYDGVMVLSHGRLLVAVRIDTILDRLTFGTALLPPPEALYFEPRLGRIHYLRRRTAADTDTDIDYQLLYTALKSEAGQGIADIINSNNTESDD